MPEGGRLTLETANCHLDDAYSRLHPGVPAGQYVLLEQSGGHVKIYSEPGQGTTVKIYLPRHYSGPSDRSLAPLAVSETVGGSETVLVVEDDASVLVMSGASLRELGYHVLEARHANEAIALFKTDQQVDLLLTDIVMPDINGRKLADEAVALRPGLKVLFMTGFTKNAIIHNGVLDPGVNFLPKPFTFEQLARKVRASPPLSDQKTAQRSRRATECSHARLDNRAMGRHAKPPPTR